MNSSDIFYYSSSISVLIVTVTFIYLVYQITISLKSLRNILDDVGDTTADVIAFKKFIKQGLSRFGTLFGEVAERGGVIYGKRKKRH